MGIDVRRIISFTWVLAAMTGCISGVLMANINTLTPHLGVVALNVLAVIILGGMNSIGGVLIAGFIIGWLEAITGLDAWDTVPRDHALHPGLACPPRASDRTVRYKRNREDLMVSNVDTATVRTSASLQARRWLWPALLAAVLIALPLFVPRYWVYFAGLLGINIVAAHGLNIMMGYTGLLSLGHAAFLGVGAYTVALAQIHLGLPFWITIPLGGFAAAVIGAASACPHCGSAACISSSRRWRLSSS